MGEKFVEEFEEDARNQKRIKPNLSKNRELVYLLSLILGDGWVEKYTIRFGSTDQVLIEIFFDLANSINVNPVVGNEEDDMVRCRFSSVIFSSWYNSLNVEDLRKLSRGHEKTFIRGLYETEGTLYVGGNSLTVNIANADYNLLSLLSDLVEGVGYRKNKIRKEERKGKKDMYRLFILGGNRNKRDFIEDISPHIKNKVSEYLVDSTLKNHYWSEAEMHFLRENYNKYTYPEIAEKLERTKSSVGQKARSLGLKKQSQSH